MNDFEIIQEALQNIPPPPINELVKAKEWVAYRRKVIKEIRRIKNERTTDIL